MPSVNFKIEDLQEMIDKVKKRMPEATHVALSHCCNYDGGEPVKDSQCVQVFGNYSHDSAGGLFCISVPYRINLLSYETNMNEEELFRNVK